MTSTRFYESLIIGLFLILPFQVSNTYADDVKDKKEPVEWLFVITSKEGEIKKNDQGQYELILKHAHIERVLAFSDRPNRIVKFISPKDFKKLWGEGKNSFEKDPPNAVAVFGQEKIAMKLMSVSVDKDKTSFVVSSDDDNMRNVKMGDVSVFVDAAACNCRQLPKLMSEPNVELTLKQQIDKSEGFPHCKTLCIIQDHKEIEGLQDNIHNLYENKKKIE